MDIMLQLMPICAREGFKPYILGAKPDILAKAVRTLEQEHPGLECAGWQDGYYDRDDEQAVMERIRDSGADCLFIAMPTPHKERIMREYKQMLNVPFIMGVGGSVDVIAGYVARAPLWMQHAGLEWFYRFVQEPRRMWKRYLTTNLAFAWLLARAKVGLYRPPAFSDNTDS